MSPFHVVKHSPLPRRDLLDHVIVFGERHARHLLKDYATHYNFWRSHLSLEKDTPFGRKVRATGVVTAIPKLGGLHHAYVRIYFSVGTGNGIFGLT